MLCHGLSIATRYVDLCERRYIDHGGLVSSRPRTPDPQYFQDSRTVTALRGVHVLLFQALAFVTSKSTELLTYLFI